MRKILGGVVLFLCLVSVNAYAIRVQVPNPFLETVGSGKSRTFFVINDGADIKAVEVSVTERKHDKLGKESRPSAGSDFKLFPEQAIIQPGQEQVFVLRYVGNKNIDYEKPYRVIVEEVPIQTSRPSSGSGTQSNIALLIKFVKSMYVLPQNSVRPKIELLSARRVIVDNKRKMSFLIKNDGRKHQIIKGLSIRVTSKVDRRKSRIISVPAREIPASNVLPFESREIVLDWIKGFPEGAISAELLTVL